MVVKVFGGGVEGIDGSIVRIEVKCWGGIKFYLVGVGECGVKEREEGMVWGVEVKGYKFGRGEIVVKMGGGDMGKEGG